MSGQRTAEPRLLSGADLELVYDFILERYVEPIDHAEVVEAARLTLRESVARSAALPIDLVPLDLLPLPTANPERDWLALSTAYDGITSRHRSWSFEARPDYVVARAMVNSLADDHSAFLTAAETRQRAETSYSGLGLLIGRPEPRGSATITHVFPSSPAALAGARPGDRILAVGDRSVVEAPLDEIGNQLRGSQGTEVVLQLERGAARAPFTVRTARRPIESPIAEGQLLEQRIGYIRIWSFTDTTPDRVGRLLLEQSQAGAQGWIVDLRGNLGGNPVSAGKAAGYFMPGKPIGLSIDRNDQRRTIIAEQRPFSLRGGAPITVLIDGQTASAAEIFAASFKEHRLATLVGQRTAGSVGVSESLALADGSSVHVTVMRLHTPSGAEISKVGVEPDVPVLLSTEDLQAGRDPQRERALLLLRERLPRS